MDEMIEAVLVEKLEDEFDKAVHESTSDEGIVEQMFDALYLALDRVETFWFHDSWDFTKKVLFGAMSYAKVDEATFNSVKTAIDSIDPNEVVKNG